MMSHEKQNIFKKNKNISHIQHISLHESKGGRHSVQTETCVLDSSKSLHEEETLGGLKVASH